MQLNIIPGKRSTRKMGKTSRRKPAAEHQGESKLPSKQTTLCSREVRKMLFKSRKQMATLTISHIPFLSLVFFFYSSQKGPSPGLQMKQLQHLVKSVLLLLENIHASNISYSQCTSERAANTGGKQNTLPDFLIIVSQVPPSSPTIS